MTVDRSQKWRIWLLPAACCAVAAPFVIAGSDRIIELIVAELRDGDYITTFYPVAIETKLVEATLAAFSLPAVTLVALAASLRPDRCALGLFAILIAAWSAAAIDVGVDVFLGHFGSLVRPHRLSTLYLALAASVYLAGATIGRAIANRSIRRIVTLKQLLVMTALCAAVFGVGRSAEINLLAMTQTIVIHGLVGISLLSLLHLAPRKWWYAGLGLAVIGLIGCVLSSYFLSPHARIVILRAYIESVIFVVAGFWWSIYFSDCVGPKQPTTEAAPTGRPTEQQPA